jgi:hypothetical protein
MEEKTKKKRVEKRAVRKKTKATEPVVAAENPVVTPTVPKTQSAPKTSKAPATETKKPRKSSKAKPSVKLIKSTTHLPTFEQVQLRAYFIAERRHKLGLPGDEHHDWLTAEQELRAELSV